MSAHGREALPFDVKQATPKKHILGFILKCVLIGVAVFAVSTTHVEPARAEERNVHMSAKIVAPTNLFIPISFNGYTVPYSKIILYDKIEKRVYAEMEVGKDGYFNLEFVLDRKKDQKKQFDLYTIYKGLESRHLGFTFKPSNYNPDRTSNIIIPPLIGVSRDQVKAGDEITILAYACPECNIVFALQGAFSTLQYSSVTDVYGYAEVRLTGGLTADNYTITATATHETRSSQPSSEVTLNVTSSFGGTYGYLPIFSNWNEFISSPLGMFITAFAILLFLSMITQSISSIWRFFTFFIIPLIGKFKKKKKEEDEPTHASPPVGDGPQFYPFVLPPPARDRSLDYLDVRQTLPEEIIQRIYPNEDGVFELSLSQGSYELTWHMVGAPPMQSSLVLDADSQFGLKKPRDTDAINVTTPSPPPKELPPISPPPRKEPEPVVVSPRQTVTLSNEVPVIVEPKRSMDPVKPILARSQFTLEPAGRSRSWIK